METIRHFVDDCTIVCCNGRCRALTLYRLFVDYCLYKQVVVLDQNFFLDVLNTFCGVECDGQYLSGIVVTPELRGANSHLWN